jgi:hypothetical protein
MKVVYDERMALEENYREAEKRQITSLLHYEEGDTSFPYPYPEPPIVLAVQSFDKFAAIWKRETCFTSSITEKCNHWAYREIVNMGVDALPFILKELKENPDYWFSALKKITGANPISLQSRGKLKEMASEWLQWAKENELSQ